MTQQEPTHLIEYDEQELARRDDIAAKAAQGYADHVYALKIFEAMCKDFLAAEKMRLRADEKHKTSSDVMLETEVRASKEWKIYRDEQIKTLREAGRKQILYENAQRRWETARSGLSARKKEVERLHR